jgi:3D (Asp-Asp-Asp) domain-containing protein
MLGAVALATLSSCSPEAPQAPAVLGRHEAHTGRLDFVATAYALEGLTKAGTRARRGIVAADPRVLPLGSRIRVSNAGRYSGEYVVEDTGAKIKGRIIDIKVGSVAEARTFGRRRIKVEVLRWGWKKKLEASSK